MGKKGSALTAGVAVVAVIAFMVALAWGMSQQKRATSLQANVEQAQERTQELKAQAERQVERQTTQIKELAEQVGELEEQLATILTPRPAPASPTIAELMEMAASGEELPAPPAEDRGEGGLRDILKMYEGEAGEKMAAMSANAAVSMHYGDLFELLEMPPEAEEMVRNILGEHMARQILAGAEMMRSDASPEESRRVQQEMEAALRADLSEVLNETGMAIYDDYQAGFQERVLRQSFDMQIALFASGLTPENREVVVDVLVEEMLSGYDPGAASMSGPEANQALDALERSRARLTTVLDEREMAQVDRFIEQQRVAFEMVRSMTNPAEPAGQGAPTE